MALVICSECGGQVSDKAKACPHCGNPMVRIVVRPKGAPRIIQGRKKPQMPTKGYWIAALCVTAFLVALCLLGDIFNTAPSSPPPRKPAPPQPLQATVLSNGISVTVTNNEDKDWKEVELTLNPSEFLRTGYSYHLDTVLAAQTVTIQAREFTSRDGTRFNPTTTKIKGLDIRVENSRRWSGSLD